VGSISNTHKKPFSVIKHRILEPRPHVPQNKRLCSWLDLKAFALQEFHGFISQLKQIQITKFAQD
jgi:hypothetical protein